MKKILFPILFLCSISVRLSAQDPCYVLNVVLDQVDEAVVQGNYDDALRMLENAKKRTDMRACDKMKNGIVDFKIDDVKKRIAERDAQKPPKPQQPANSSGNTNKPTTSTNPTKPTTSASTSSCPDDNHPHKIDLGLPSGTLWACCNVDADSPEDYGGYYAWGETTTKSEYSWENYKHCDGDYDSCHDLGSSICGTQYDVAHVKWGGSWQLPTKEQIEELLDKCDWGEWTTRNGVEGRKFTGPNGGSIFLPAATSSGGTDLYLSGSYGGYWSGTQYPSDSYHAYYLPFNSDLADRYHYVRCEGRTVRPVSE